MEKKVEKEVKCLEKKALEELRKIWKKVFGEDQLIPRKIVLTVPGFEH